MTPKETIWRDGNRIASHHHGGFADAVPDERLAEYAADEASSPSDRAFAAAVLALRRFERESELWLRRSGF